MNAHTTIAKPRRQAKAAAAPVAEILPPVAARIVPSSPRPIALSRLRRAPENVRHVRVDEDVSTLTDDIAAHGLLQSLIGYEGDHAIDAACVYIVGGGRRFQALRELENRGLIDGDFPVPVLIRPVEDAIELSLAENLQQRTMSPVDEFVAFSKLMERGTESPASLAKRFGFTEQKVKQRLKLAQLDSEVLDALAARQLTLDTAMAYATTSDRHVQRDVFRKLAKKYRDRGISSTDVRYAIAADTQTEAWPLFRFVGAKVYEREGGGYEEGLFDLETAADGKRRLDNAFIVITQAHQLIDFQMLRLQAEWADELELAREQVTGFVKVKDLQFGRHHMAYHGIEKQAPDNYAWVGNDYNPDRVARMLKTIRNNRMLVQLPVGIDDDGKLIRIPKGFFVPKDQVRAIDPPAQSVNAGYRAPTPAEEAAARRQREVDRIARRRAVGAFTGTPFEDRAFWPEQWDDRSKPTTIDGVSGYLVSVLIFAPDTAIAAEAGAAEAEYEQVAATRAERDRTEKAAREQAATARLARDAELRAMEPPAVVVIEGDAWGRAEDGSYAPTGDLGVDTDVQYETWHDLLDSVPTDDVLATYATVTEHAAALADTGADQGDEVRA